MTAGQTFEEAIKAIHAGFGGRPGLLKMEEEYRFARLQRSGPAVWKQVRRLVQGDRMPIAFALFGLVVTVNRLTGYGWLVDILTDVGRIYLHYKILLTLISGAVLRWKGGDSAEWRASWQHSWLFLTLFAVAQCLLWLDGRLPTEASFSPNVRLALASLVQTLCLLLYTATLIQLARYVRSKRLTVKTP